MAYILGFTYADGNVYKTSLAWEVQIRDDDILPKIKKASKATYPIQKRSNSWRLRISNQILINGAIKKGLFPKKNMRNAFPKIPKNFIKHFIRGYLDGDGWIVLRKNRNEVDVGFANGRREFLDILNKTISKILDIVPSKVRTKIKLTPRNITATTHQLEFYSSNAIKIARWLYGGLNKRDLYLDRKYNKYIEADKLYDFLESGTRKVRIIQKTFGKNIKEIIAKYTTEAGVRNLERELSKIARKVAKIIALKGNKAHKTTSVISSTTLHNYLGPAKYSSNIAEKKNSVGMATGLAWTSVGGEILFIEVSTMPGKGIVQITGQLGDVMKESAQAAYTYVRSHYADFGLKSDFYKTIDLHIHVPEGAVPKDGPSAGVTMTTAIVSTLTKRAVKKNLGMTGEVTLRGRVLEIGGLKEKVIAAHTAGLREIIHPWENTKDLEKIPSEIKKDMTFHPVKEVSEVLKLALI